MNKEQKAAVVAELERDFGSCDTMFVADYRGLDVPGISDLRDRLRGIDAEFKVVKNTLAKIAAEKAGNDDIADMFAGPSAVAFVRGDVAGVAKVLRDFGKDKNLLELRGGLMDGKRVSPEQVKDIAALPPRDTILAMLLSAVNAPMVQTVGVLAAPMRDIVMVLDAYIEKRQAEEGSAA